MIITTKDTEQRGGQARVTHERLLLIARHRRLAEEYRALLMTRKPARRDRLPGFALMAVEAADAAATKRLRKSWIEIGGKVRMAAIRRRNNQCSVASATAMTRVLMPHPGRETGERKFRGDPHRPDRNPAGRERLLAR
jgi:hypothetical protein